MLADRFGVLSEGFVYYNVFADRFVDVLSDGLAYNIALADLFGDMLSDGFVSDGLAYNIALAVLFGHVLLQVLCMVSQYILEPTWLERALDSPLSPAPVSPTDRPGRAHLARARLLLLKA